MSAAPKMKEHIKFRIEVMKGPHQGLKIHFDKPSVFIGRGPENDVVLANDPRASRQHAEIKVHGNEFVVVNLSLKNQVLLNGQGVQSEILTTGSVISVGDSEIHFFPDKAVPSSESGGVRSSSLTAVSVGKNSPVSGAVVPGLAQSHSPTPFGSGDVPPQHNSIPIFQSPPVSPAHLGRPGSPPRNSKARPRSTSANRRHESSDSSRARFYGIIVVLGLVGWWLFSPSKSKPAKDPNAIRTAPMSMQDVAEAEKRSQQLLTVKKEKYDSIQGRRAQENFVKGFRDFQQGQYARARESFQVVLNLDPENELAKRYYHLSKIKFDELVKFNMIQGNRYREKRSWRICQSNYSNVMTMLQNRKDDPTYKEAKQYFEECTLNLEGRY